MSKNYKVETSDTEVVGWGAGYVIDENNISFLQGRLFTLIEAMGLKESQEKSIKDLIKNEIWNLTYNQSLFIFSEMRTQLCKIMGLYNKRNDATIPRAESINSIKRKVKIEIIEED